jgi:hypothetical protein
VQGDHSSKEGLGSQGGEVIERERKLADGKISI